MNKRLLLLFLIIVILITILLEVTMGKLSAVETLSLYLPPSLQSRRQLISNSSVLLCPSEVRHTILHTQIKEHHNGTNCSSMRQKTHVHVQQSE